MEYTTVYVGMDVHKESFTLACYTNEKEKAEYVQKTESHYIPRHDEDLREPLVLRQGSQVSMRLARGSRGSS